MVRKRRDAKKWSNVAMVALALVTDGYIEAYDAVYKWTEPFSNIIHRNTRVAATICYLKQAYGWDIVNVNDTSLYSREGEEKPPIGRKLARYELRKIGYMPDMPSTYRQMYLLGLTEPDEDD